MAVITRHDDGALTYEIDDPYATGIVEVSVEALVELFALAGIKPGGKP